MSGDTLSSRLKHAWNVFLNRDPTRSSTYTSVGVSYGIRPDRVRLTVRNERSMITSIYNRIALDVASIELRHCTQDSNGRYKETQNSGLNECLSTQANLDQTSKAFIQDVILSMFDEGCVAIVPVERDIDPDNPDSVDIYQMRAGRITQWYPKDVKVELYNEIEGKKRELILPKKDIAIIENPFYAVMNEPNATVKRLVDKLNLLDYIDKQSTSGKLDLIIQLPYSLRSELKKENAAKRKEEIESQLRDSPYGIAYIDSSEKVTQLNRPVENNLMKTIEYLTVQMFAQLGVTQSIMDGSADTKTMQNYYARIIEPIVSALVDEMKRKFLTKTARSNGQSIFMFRDPFKLVPVSDIAEIADKLTRNEIASSNEIRQIIGWKPSDDPRADELRNKNLNEAKTGTQVAVENEQKEENQNGV